MVPVPSFAYPYTAMVSLDVLMAGYQHTSEQTERTVCISSFPRHFCFSQMYAWSLAWSLAKNCQQLKFLIAKTTDILSAGMRACFRSIFTKLFLSKNRFHGDNEINAQLCPWKIYKKNIFGQVYTFINVLVCTIQGYKQKHFREK